MKTAIIIDSTSYVNEGLRNHPDVYELFLTTTFEDGTQFLDSTDVKVQKDFYNKLQASDKLPTTSQPALGEYIALIEEIIEKGYDQLLCIHLSKTFSGTCQTAKMLIDEYKDQINGHVVDSKGVSLIIGALVEQALDMIEKEVPFEDICRNTEWSAKRGTIYLTVSDLENLAKSGRANKAVAKIGGLLKIRPLLCVNAKGEVELLEKIRTDKKVNQRLSQIAQEDYEKFNGKMMLKFAHAVDREKLQDAIDVVHEKLPHLDYEVGTLGPVIGTHTGAGTVGMGTIPIADY
ncbi:MAG TPA: DegV family protein [Candidatus Atopostipes pullistercoris]|uniref:DegV family protein n=1 Tax=Candidatus Atopostipes pullistercoris TaxID=2838467 RepID=A0A9D2G3N0_9LACT|nr:DegV family protein [Candidatus Atopostipes pullistercoris]